MPRRRALRALSKGRPRKLGYFTGDAMVGKKRDKAVAEGRHAVWVMDLHAKLCWACSDGNEDIDAPGKAVKELEGPDEKSIVRSYSGRA